MFSTQHIDAIGGFLNFIFWWFMITAALGLLAIVGGIGFFIWWLFQ